MHPRIGAAGLGALWLLAATIIIWVTLKSVEPLVWGTRPPVLSVEAVEGAAASVSPAPSTPSPSSTHPATAKPGTAGPSTTTKTIKVDGGIVTIGCDKAAASLESAQAEPGWALDLSNRGPQRVEVAFVAGERETEVEAYCLRGVPVMNGRTG